MLYYYSSSFLSYLAFIVFHDLFILFHIYFHPENNYIPFF